MSCIWPAWDILWHCLNESFYAGVSKPYGLHLASLLPTESLVLLARESFVGHTTLQHADMVSWTTAQHTHTVDRLSVRLIPISTFCCWTPPILMTHGIKADRSAMGPDAQLAHEHANRQHGRPFNAHHVLTWFTRVMLANLPSAQLGTAEAPACPTEYSSLQD